MFYHKKKLFILSHCLTICKSLKPFLNLTNELELVMIETTTGASFDVYHQKGVRLCNQVLPMNIIY